MDLWNIITAQFADLVPIAYPCLWKDEDNEPVLITRTMEISRWDDDTLCLYVGSAPCASQLRSSGLISHEGETRRRIPCPLRQNGKSALDNAFRASFQKTAASRRNLDKKATGDSWAQVDSLSSYCRVRFG